jgi:hypothetical protein
MPSVVRTPPRAGPRAGPRLGPRLAPALACALAVTVFAACSSDKKSTTPPSSTTVSSSATTSSTASTTSSTGPTTTSTTPPTTGGTGTTISGASVFSGYTVTPPSPVSCNAPTMIELKWTSTGVSSVALLVDDKPFATYGGGFQDHLEYFACDGAPHTYTLQARKGTSTVTSVQVVRSKAP